jgi:hypothetical protein
LLVLGGETLKGANKMGDMTNPNRDLESGYWKFDEDYVVREWTNVHGDKCKQMGNVWVEEYRNSAGGISTHESFVSTSDC